MKTNSANDLLLCGTVNLASCVSGEFEVANVLKTGFKSSPPYGFWKMLAVVAGPSIDGISVVKLL